MTDPATALAEVNSRIAHAAKIAQRKAEEVILIAVSKTHPATAIAPLILAGQRVFGENRVQEAQANSRSECTEVSRKMSGPRASSCGEP